MCGNDKRELLDSRKGTGWGSTKSASGGNVLLESSPPKTMVCTEDRSRDCGGFGRLGRHRSQNGEGAQKVEGKGQR